MHTIPHRIEAVARANWTKPFAIFRLDRERKMMTYGDLWRRATTLAAGLQELGCAPGQLVLIVHETDADLFGAFLGAMLIGAIPSIMPPPSPKQRHDLFWSGHATLYEKLQPKVILASRRVCDAYTARLPFFADRIVEPEQLAAMTRGSAPGTLAAPEASAVAFLQHSSGTTALKKGVALTHAKVLRHIDGYARAVGLNDDGIIASWLPYYHDMGLIACFVLPVCHGATVVVLDPLEWSARPQRLIEAVGEHRATHLWLPNFAFEHLCNGVRDVRDFDLSSLRVVVNCSEPCRRGTQERFVRHFAPAGLRHGAVQVCYAMAENVFTVTQTPIGGQPRFFRIAADAIEEGTELRPHGEDAAGVDVLSCGPALEGVRLRIVDRNRAILGDRCIGEIAIATDTLFDGYYRRPDLTERALDGEWYYTGDIGFTVDGELFVVGRRDDMIVTFGRNLLAYEIEAVLNQLPGVIPGRSVAFGVEAEGLGTRELAVMCEASDETARDVLARSVRASVEAACGLAPRHVLIVPRGSLAKTTSGKISRAANRQLFLAGQAQVVSAAATAMAEEE